MAVNRAKREAVKGKREQMRRRRNRSDGSFWVTAVNAELREPQAGFCSIE
jgi:hypothetical protein